MDLRDRQRSVIGNGTLRSRDFRQLIEENQWISQVELSNRGEIFLNPELLEILECAYYHRVRLTADNGVNLNFIDERVLEGLVKYRLQSLTCSIDGASQDTYALYRVGGSFRTVIENIEKINATKAKWQSSVPRLTWQFIVFGHNEHEIALARRMARSLNMQFCLKLSWEPSFSSIQDKELVVQELGFAATSRSEYKELYGIEYLRTICYQLWTAPQINWDGRVLGCCVNFWRDFGGNAFTDGLLACINSEKICYARNMLLGNTSARNDIPCSSCKRYLTLAGHDKWLTQSQVFGLETC